MRRAGECPANSSVFLRRRRLRRTGYGLIVTGNEPGHYLRLLGTAKAFTPDAARKSEL
jgi:hypothetical protein